MAVAGAGDGDGAAGCLPRLHPASKKPARRTLTESIQQCVRTGLIGDGFNAPVLLNAVQVPVQRCGRPRYPTGRRPLLLTMFDPEDMNSKLSEMKKAKKDRKRKRKKAK